MTEQSIESSIETARASVQRFRAFAATLIECVRIDDGDEAAADVAAECREFVGQYEQPIAAIERAAPVLAYAPITRARVIADLERAAEKLDSRVESMRASMLPTRGEA